MRIVFDMACYREEFTVSTSAHDQVVDVTAQVCRALERAGAREGVCTVYTPHATAAVTINENDDPNVGTDFLNALKKLIREHDQWLHDRVDDNAAAHIKAALVGPSQSIPVGEGKLLLGRWQNVFLCEFDGPRRERRVLVTVVW